jgi:hypothetical protein
MTDAAGNGAVRYRLHRRSRDGQGREGRGGRMTAVDEVGMASVSESGHTQKNCTDKGGLTRLARFDGSKYVAVKAPSSTRQITFGAPNASTIDTF